MRQNLFFLMIFTAIVLGCKKEVKSSSCETVVEKNYTYDTVKPSDYLMAYPGSTWTYTNGTSTYTDSCNSWKNVSIAKVLINGNCKTILEDMLVLPRYSSRYISFESEVRSYTDLQETEFVPLISETPGEIYNVTKKSDSGYTTTIVTSFGKIDSMIIGSIVYYDVLHMRQDDRTYYTAAYGGPSYKYDYYYSKGIGRIRFALWLNQNGTNLDTWDLVSYNIAPH